MKEFFVEVIMKYGIESVVLALIINLLTGIIKIPIKKSAKKLSDSSKVTRFIVFLPILLGYLISLLYYEVILDGFIFDEGFVTLWVTSTSLSLTIYAVIENLFPKKKKQQEEDYIKSTENILEIMNVFITEIVKPSLKLKQEEPQKKLVLKGSINNSNKIDN